MAGTVGAARSSVPPSEKGAPDLVPVPEGPTLSASAEWRRHWTLVLAAIVGVSFVTFPTYTAAFFFEPLSREFGWSRTTISSGISIGSVVLVVLVPVASKAAAEAQVRALGIAAEVWT